jgi:flavin-dependent dehydrogenase
MDWDNQLVRSYARQYINIDRSAFDHWLLSLVPQTVDVRHNALYQKSEPNAENRTLHFTENGEPKTAQVRWLVGADGAFSTIRREFFADAPFPKRYIAVQHCFEQDAVSIAPKFGIDIWRDYTGIFDSALTDFYIWTIPKEGQLILGGAFPLGSNASAVMQTVKATLESLGLRLGTPCKREAGQVVRPLSQSSFCFGDAQTILMGEASGLISPSSAEGISGALMSAFYLAEAFSKGTLQQMGFDPALYRRLLRNLLWHLRLKRFRIPLMFNPRLRKYVMRSGLTALRR